MGGPPTTLAPQLHESSNSGSGPRNRTVNVGMYTGAVAVGVGDAVLLAVAVEVLDAVAVGVADGVDVVVAVGVLVEVAAVVGVLEAVDVGVPVAVDEGTAVGVFVDVATLVGVRVGGVVGVAVEVFGGGAVLVTVGATHRPSIHMPSPQSSFPQQLPADRHRAVPPSPAQQRSFAAQQRSPQVCSVAQHNSSP